MNYQPLPERQDQLFSARWELFVWNIHELRESVKGLFSHRGLRFLLLYLLISLVPTALMPSLNFFP